MNQSLEEAVGQLLLGKVPSTDLDSDNESCLRSGIMRGITIFSENVQSQEQLIDLTDAVRAASMHPSLVACDQEGGAVQRLDKIVSPIPSMMALGMLNDRERIELIIGIAGKQMKALGINCVFAPVLDVNTNPKNPIIGTRAFGSDTELVSKLGGIVLRSYLESGVLPVGKHFPGHGDSDVDSHLSLPKLSHALTRLEQIELVPFVENLLIAPALMVAHLWISAFNQEALPASMSKEVISFLREDLGYQHMLVSDDMLMKAIGNMWGLEEACVRSIEAGLDLLLVCTDAEKVRSVNAAIAKAVKDGRISESRLEHAQRTVQVALKKLPRPDEFDKNKRLSILKKTVAASDSLMLDSSAKAIDLSRGIPRQIFSRPGPIHLFIPQHDRYQLQFKEALLKELPQLETRLIEHRFPFATVSEEQCTELANSCGENCILFTFRAVINQDQLRLVKALSARASNRLLIACDIPYDLDLIPDWDDAAAICDPSNLAVRAFAKLIARQLGA